MGKERKRGGRDGDGEEERGEGGGMGEGEEERGGGMGKGEEGGGMRGHSISRINRVLQRAKTKSR